MGDIIGGSIRTDSSGRTTVTGVGSDIDFGETVDAIIEARRQPAVRLENRIAENQVKVDAFSELQSRLATLEDAASALRGRPSFDNAGNVFEQKDGFLTATRQDTQQPSTATSILAANVENSAETGSHDLEVLRTAQAQQLGSSFVSNAGADLNTADGLGTFNGGSFQINGREVTVDAADSLLDVRDKINAANSGGNATGVNAQVVSVSDTQKILTLTAETPGEAINLQDTTNSPLQELGIIDANGDPVNELRANESAVLRVNGLSDGSVQESDAFAGVDPATTTLDDPAIGATSGTFDLAFELNTSGRENPVSRTLTGVDTTTTTLNDLAQRINDEVDGVSARIVDDGNGPRLETNAEFLGDLQETGDLGIAGTDTLDQVSGVDGGETISFRISNERPDGTGTVSQTFSFDPSAKTLDDLVADIDAAGIDANAFVANGALKIESTNGGQLKVADLDGEFTEQIGLEQSNDIPTLTTSDSTGDITASLNIQDAAAIGRKTNTIDNLFQGTTISLFKAERGTNLQFDIERNAAAVGEQINAFVDAFNDVRQFVNAQRQERALEGQDPDAEDSTVGALNNDSILRQVDQRLSQLLSSGATNTQGDFQVLAQAGIDFVNNDNLSDPTLEDTLEVDQDALNDVLINDFDNLRSLFEFQFTSQDSNAQLTGFTETTAATDATFDVETDANGDITRLFVDGTELTEAAGEVEFNGNRFTIQDGALNGLSVLFDETNSALGDPFDISTSTGVGSETFFTADSLSNNNANDGVIQTEIDRLIGRDDANITGVNDRLQEQIDRIDRRLERERERLVRQFTAMEQALIELESSQQRLDALANQGSNN